MKNRLRVESTVLPGKLSDCSSRDVEKRELLIVEEKALVDQRSKAVIGLFKQYYRSEEKY